MIPLTRGKLAAIAGLVTEAGGSIGGSDHSIIVAIIAATATVMVAIVGPIVSNRWGSRETRRLTAEIHRKDKRIEVLEAEVDELIRDKR